MSLPTQTDLIIVGGGMVGVTLALLMAQRMPEKQVLLLESMRFPALPENEPLPYTAGFDARNTALSRRTVQAFTDLSLWPQLQPHAVPIHEIHVSDRGHFGFSRLNAAEERVESFGQVIENAWLGVVLLAALKQCPSVVIADGVEVKQLITGSEKASVRCQTAQGEMTISAPLVVAADGTHSQCRDWLGLSAQWHDYQQTALVTTVATSLPHEHRAFERFTASGPIALLPLPDFADGAKQTRRSLVWALSTAEAERIKALDDKAFMQELQAAFGRRAGRFQRVGQRHAYPLQLMVAPKQTLSRAAIMGNAAHSLHPVAGQGFNLCLRDALVLVERLAQASTNQQDWGDATLLASYEASRQSDQSQIIRFSDSLVRGFSSAAPALVLLRNIGLVGFDLLPGAKPTLARYAMGLDHV